MQLVLEQGLAQRFFDLALTGTGVLPVREADVAHDFVDVGYDALYDDGSVLVADFFKEFVRAALPRSSSSSGGTFFLLRYPNQV